MRQHGIGCVGAENPGGVSIVNSNVMDEVVGDSDVLIDHLRARIGRATYGIAAGMVRLQLDATYHHRTAGDLLEHAAGDVDRVHAEAELSHMCIVVVSDPKRYAPQIDETVAHEGDVLRD